MKKVVFIFFFDGIITLFLLGLLMGLAVATEISLECRYEGKCKKPVVQKPPIELESEPQPPVTSRHPLSSDNNGEKPECVIEVNFEQAKCDKSYDELKSLWQSLKQDFDNTSQSVLILHKIVNQDEINLKIDKCDCYLIEVESAYKQSAIADINNLLGGLKHLHSCLSKMNKRMLENPLVLELVLDSMLSDIKKLIELSEDRIKKICSFREYRIPKYKEYIDKISKGCEIMGRTPDVLKCKN